MGKPASAPIAVPLRCGPHWAHWRLVHKASEVFRVGAEGTTYSPAKRAAYDTWQHWRERPRELAAALLTWMRTSRAKKDLKSAEHFIGPALIVLFGRMFRTEKFDTDVQDECLVEVAALLISLTEGRESGNLPCSRLAQAVSAFWKEEVPGFAKHRLPDQILYAWYEVFLIFGDGTSPAPLAPPFSKVVVAT